MRPCLARALVQSMHSPRLHARACSFGSAHTYGSSLIKRRYAYECAVLPWCCAGTWNAKQFLEFIAKWSFFETLPNLTVIFRLFLTICVSVASCERNFSKLKLIKMSLRSTMSDERLSNMSILSIEKERVKNINFTTVINNFAEAKCRRKNLWRNWMFSFRDTNAQYKKTSCVLIMCT